VTLGVTHRAAREALHSLLEALPDAAILVNQSSVIRLANGRAAQLFGFTAEELRGQHLDVLLDPRDRARALAALGSGSGIEQLRGARKDGTEIAMRVCFNAMEPSAAVPTRAFVVVARTAICCRAGLMMVAWTGSMMVKLGSEGQVVGWFVRVVGRWCRRRGPRRRRARASG